MRRAVPVSRPALVLLLSLGLAGAAAAPAFAQPPVPSQGLVVRDGTLGNAAAGVVPSGPDDRGTATYLIRADLGELRGGNLFHSFERFSIARGERATFSGDGAADPGAIDHVISRVTGGTRSQIDGELHSTIPGADVWLFNPQGVGFGAGAEIDVPGSFHAGSADSVEFEDGGEPFRAEATPPSVLATAKPSAFGFLPDGTRAALVVEGGLRVTRGQALLSGGDVTLTGAGLLAPGAQLGFEATGAVRLEADSTVDVGGFTPGSVSIRSGKIHVVSGSRVLAENASRVPSEDPAEPGPGSIELEATAPVESVLVEDGLLSVSTHGAGNAGTLRVVAPAVTLQEGPGDSDSGLPHELARGARAQTTAGGRGGEIAIEAGTLTLTNGVGVSVVAVGSQATGDAGNIFIRADAVDISNRSRIAAAGWQSAGKAGTVTIDLGATGTLKVDAAKVITNKPAYAHILANGSGTPGTIEILGGSRVEVVNGGRIESPCQGPCASEVGGTVRIGTAEKPVDRVELQSGGVLGAPALASTTGNAGTVDVYANTLIVNGTIDTATSGTGNAGEITLTAAHELTVAGRIDARTNGTAPSSGRGGTIALHGDSVVIGSGGVVDAGTGGTGNAGDLTVDARTLTIGPGQPAFLTVSSFAPLSIPPDFVPGNAGTLQVVATESIELTNAGGEQLPLADALTFSPVRLTGIFSATVLGGDGGSIALTAPLIRVGSGALVATSTLGGGKGGTIRLNGIDGGQILIEAGGGVDSTSVPWEGRSSGDAGDVTLVADRSIEVLGSDAEFGVSRVMSASLGSGAAGMLSLAAPRIAIDGGAVLTTALPSGPQSDGTQRQGTRGGDIALAAGEELVVANGGRVDASTFIPGAGGRIDARAGQRIRVEGEASGIASRTGGSAAGGAVSLAAPVIELRSGGSVSAASAAGLDELLRTFTTGTQQGLVGTIPAQATGDAGAVSLAASHLVHLDGGHITTSVGVAHGGDITIDPAFVILQHGASIRSEALQDEGFGGRIRITTDSFFQFPASAVSAQGRTPEFSGTVEIHSPDVNLAGTLAELPSGFLDAASQMRERCAARKSGERVGSFAVRGAGGIPAEPDGWLPAPLLPAPASIAAPIPGPVLVASLGAPLLPQRSCP